MELEERSRFPTELVLGAMVVLALAAGAYLFLRSTQNAGSGAEPPLPFGPLEQAYAQHIHFRNLQMSRAANFLNQEITFLSGEIENAGTRTVRDMQVRVEYRDSLHQVVLRETLRPLGWPRPVSVPAGQTRPFQLAFEHIPDEWNHEYPAIRVTGLLLE